MALKTPSASSSSPEYVSKGFTNCQTYTFPKNFCGYLNAQSDGHISFLDGGTIFQQTSTSSSNGPATNILIAKNAQVIGCGGEWVITGYLFD